MAKKKINDNYEVPAKLLVTYVFKADTMARSTEYNSEVIDECDLEEFSKSHVVIFCWKLS